MKEKEKNNEVFSRAAVSKHFLSLSRIALKKGSFWAMQSLPCLLFCFLWPLRLPRRLEFSVLTTPKEIPEIADVLIANLRSARKLVTKPSEGGLNNDLFLYLWGSDF